jgi:hypothetical protein
MYDYRRITESPDFLCVALSRTFSQLGTLWLRDYVEIGRKTLLPDETSKILNSMDGSLARMLADRREVRIRLGDKFVEDERAINAAKISSMLMVDTIGAHEIGKEGYPGHFEFLLNRKKALPESIFWQDKLNFLGLKTLINFDDKNLMKIYLKELYAYVSYYLQYDWLSEMFALALSQKVRLINHLKHENLEPEVRETLNKGLEEITNPNDLDDVYGVGLLIYKRLEEKFKNRLDLILHLISLPLICDKIKGALYADEPLFDERVPTLDFQPIPAHYVLFSALETEGGEKPREDVFKVLEKSGNQNPRLMTRSEYFTQVLDARNFPESQRWFLSIFLGDIWLALHSMVSIVVLAKHGGIRIVLLPSEMEKSLDSKALEIAYQVLQLRNTLLEHVHLEIDPLLCKVRYQKIIEIAKGESSLLDYVCSSPPLGSIGARTDFGLSNPLESYQPLLQLLKYYYLEHKEKLHKYAMNPTLFFSKTVS